MGESVANYLAAVGIKSRVRGMERATFMEAWRTKTRQGVFVTVTAAPGNAALPDRELRHQHRALRHRRLPGHRRAVPAASARAGPQEA